MSWRDMKLRAKTVRVRPPFWLYLSSDQHIGGRDTDYGLIKAEIAKAKELGAYTILNGDLFDMILPGDKKRFSLDALHPDVAKSSDIVNAAVDMAVELYRPIASQIVALGFGNHENAVLRHHSVDVMELFRRKLVEAGGDPQYWGPMGVVVFAMSAPGKHTGRFVVHYTHGAGGESPVTQGMIDFHRQRTWVVDAHLLTMGHKHNAIETTNTKMRVGLDGAVYLEEIAQVMTSAYVRYSLKGYAAARDMAPRPLGGAFVQVGATRARYGGARSGTLAPVVVSVGRGAGV